MSTTLRLTNEDGTITIETTQNVDGCGEFINHLVRPILKAMGYQDVTVNEYIGDFEEASGWLSQRLTRLLEEHRSQDDGGVTSSPDYKPDPPEWKFGDALATIEGAPYVDPYDAPIPKKPKHKAKKK